MIKINTIFILLGYCLIITNGNHTSDDFLKFDNIVLEGGGSRAISHVGAILALKEMGYYTGGRYTFNKIGGTSSGCFVGFLLSLDIKPAKLESLVYKTDIFQNSVDFNTNLFSSKDAPEKSSTHTWFNTIMKTYQLINKARDIVDLWLDYDSPGLSTEEMFVKFLTEVILPLSPHKKLIDDLKLLTFNDLYKITNHELHCFSTQLTDKIVYEFSVKRTPNENVLKAIYASITLPGIFKPLDDGNGNTLVDGALLYNFPITMNDRGLKINNRTLGLSLNAKREHTQSLMSMKNDITNSEKRKFKFNTLNTLEYLGALYTVILNREALLYSQNSINKDRVIYLDSPLKTIEFNINHNRISLAINKAYLNTLTFLKGLSKNNYLNY